MPRPAGDILLSVRAQIPDPAPGDDPRLDGGAFRAATLLRWLNDACRIVAASAPIIRDWWGVPTEAGQDVYLLPSWIMSVEEAWYDRLPMRKAPEGETLWLNRTQGRSWWFGPHRVHASPAVHLWPAPDRTSASVALSSAVTPTQTTLPVASVANVGPFGFAQIQGPTELELVRFGGTQDAPPALTQVIRGEGSTVPRAWPGGTPVRICTLFMRVSRLPKPLVTPDDPVEIPEPLWPLLESYILARVREAEQDHGVALQLNALFQKGVADLVERVASAGVRTGLQIKIGPPPTSFALFRGRTVIP